jgi:hypothetical protein
METTITTPEPDDAARRAAIEERIERYTKPVSLDPQLVTQVLPRLKELARLAGPTAPEDAKNLLTAVCRLIADTCDSDEDVNVDVVLSEEAVARWSHAAKRGRMPAGTLANYLRFLNRLVRARNGLPPRTATRRAPATRPKLLAAEALHDLADTLVDGDAGAAVALVAAAGAGLVPTSTPVAIAVADGPVAVQDQAAVAVGDRWRDLASRLAGGAADPAAWSRLRAAGTAAGLELTVSGLRLRWAVDVATAARTPQAAVHAGLPRKLLNQAIRHLPPVDDQTARAALRG